MYDNRIYTYVTNRQGNIDYDLTDNAPLCNRFSTKVTSVRTIPAGVSYIDLSTAKKIEGYIDYIIDQESKDRCIIAILPARTNTAYFKKVFTKAKRITFISGKYWIDADTLSNKSVVLVEFNGVIKGMPSVFYLDLDQYFFKHSSMCRVSTLKRIQEMNTSYF